MVYIYKCSMVYINTPYNSLLIGRRGSPEVALDFRFCLLVRKETKTYCAFILLKPKLTGLLCANFEFRKSYWRAIWVTYETE